MAEQENEIYMHEKCLLNTIVHELKDNGILNALNIIEKRLHSEKVGWNLYYSHQM